MTEFQRGYLFGIVAASIAWVVYLVVDDYLVKSTIPSVKLVVLDRRDMAERTDNADDRTPDRMAGSGESGSKS
jgi:hypothetical protein